MSIVHRPTERSPAVERHQPTTTSKRRFLFIVTKSSLGLTPLLLPSTPPGRKQLIGESNTRGNKATKIVTRLITSKGYSVIDGAGGRINPNDQVTEEAVAGFGKAGIAPNSFYQ
ncbi:unnamed protein product [Dicrocoelium dendriticum]|nr:unnamed protein product [Dicrocoelium dendriticum]